MSKKSFSKTPYFAYSGIFLQIFTIFVVAAGLAEAADLSASVELGSDGVAIVRGRLQKDFVPLNPRNFYFRLTPDEARARLSQLRLLDDSGGPVSFREMIPGEYLAERPFSAFEYKMQLSAAGRGLVAGRSTLNADTAILYTDDILPRIEARGRPVSAEIQILAGSQCFSADAGDGKNFRFDDIVRGVVICGSGLRINRLQADGNTIGLLAAGGRDFTDAEAEEMITEIFGFYVRRLGRLQGGAILISILPSGKAERTGQWEAETRGRAVTIISSDMPFRNQSLQRLHEQLRHELFHLWIPNSVRLTGDYALFYEGLATYAALQCGVALRRIRFDDFLTTISVASANAERDAGRAAHVTGRPSYSLGTVAAFAADVKILSRSRGSRGLLDETAAVYSRFSSPSASADGAEIFRTLFAVNLSSIGAELDAALAASGLEFADRRLRVVSRPSGRQRAILRKIGYNL